MSATLFGMTQWIEDSVERIKRMDERKQKEREWQLHKAAVIPAKSKQLWEDLSESIERDVLSFNDCFSEIPSRRFNFSRSSDRIKLKRSYFPSVEMNISFGTDGVSWKTYTRASMHASPRQISQRIGFDLAETDDLYFLDKNGAVATPGEIAQFILQPVLDLQ
jgi:hypothetical protein